MKPNLIKLAILATLPLASNVNAATVDLFTTNQSQIKDTNAIGGSTTAGTYQSSSVSTAGTDIIGGTRDLLVDLYATGIGYVPGNGTSLTVFGGTLAFNNDVGSTGLGVVQWDGTTGITNTPATDFGINYTGLGGTNLLTTGNAIQYTVLAADHGFPITLEAFTDSTHFTKVTVGATGPGTESISFAAMMTGVLCGYDSSIAADVALATSMGFFTNPSFAAVETVTCGGSNVFNGISVGQTVDFAHLGALQTIINPAPGGTVAVDLAITEITTVPEPSIIGLIGAGVLAAGFVGTRRRTGSLQA